MESSEFANNHFSTFKRIGIDGIDFIELKNGTNQDCIQEDMFLHAYASFKDERVFRFFETGVHGLVAGIDISECQKQTMITVYSQNFYDDEDYIDYRVLREYLLPSNELNADEATFEVNNSISLVSLIMSSK